MSKANVSKAFSRSPNGAFHRWHIQPFLSRDIRNSQVGRRNLTTKFAGLKQHFVRPSMVCGVTVNERQRSSLVPTVPSQLNKKTTEQ